LLLDNLIFIDTYTLICYNISNMSEIIQLPLSEFSSVEGASPFAENVYSITDAPDNRLTGELPNLAYYDESTRFVDAQLSPPEPQPAERRTYRSATPLDRETVSALIGIISRMGSSSDSAPREVPAETRVPELEMSMSDLDFELKLLGLLALMGLQNRINKEARRDSVVLAA
jgi:hypothetical protein